MQAVILCGGLGTRLREETEFRPKPMVKIGNMPILWHVMKIYAHQGVKDFVLCLGYKGEMIKEFFWNYEMLNNDFTIELGQDRRAIVHRSHDEKGWRVTLADTGDKAQKGARLKRIEKYISVSDFFVTYGDGVADVDMRRLMEFHRAHGKLATVTGVSAAARFGELRIKGSTVESFSEKPTRSANLVNGGFFVFNRGIFDHLALDDSCDLEYGVLEHLARRGELMVYQHEGFWACMDTPRYMEHLNHLWEARQAHWNIW